MLKLDYVLPDDIPDMDMYMEQLISFMDDELGSNLRSEDDKALTKNMVNNYTKNKLLPPPEKKKYSRDHLIYLIYIYYMKSVMSINDIEKMMTPLQSEDIDSDKLYDIYQKTFEMEKAEYFNIEDSIVNTMEIVTKKLPAFEDDKLSRMLYIFLLGYDVYTKKKLIEKLIDDMDE